MKKVGNNKGNNNRIAKSNTSGIALHNPYVRIKNATSGITLIALVITIIVLLILAGVSIATLTGDNGILTQASKAKKETEEAKKKEENDLKELEQYMNNIVVSEAGYDSAGGVNKPNLKSGMIPVYYDDSKSMEKSR